MNKTPEEPTQLFESLDAVLLDLDEVLSDDPMDVVRSFVQAGGNGGGELNALVQQWIESHGVDLDLFFLLSQTPDSLHEYVLPRDIAVSSDDARLLVFQLQFFDWPSMLIAMRYGIATALYWQSSQFSLSDLSQSTELSVFAENHSERQMRADRLYRELGIRVAESAHDFSEVRRQLEEIEMRYPSQVGDLLDEYKYILTTPIIADNHALSGEKYQEEQLFKRIAAFKRLINPLPTAPDDDSANVAADDDDVSPEEPVVRAEHSPISSPANRFAPTASVHLGATLEDATQRLLSRLFRTRDSDASQVLQALRRQRAGTQFGKDVSFTVSSSKGTSRCHVECKNYTSPITTDDIAGKLLQIKHYSRDSPFDHWILISPHQDPSNELAELLAAWEETSEYDFSIQVWSPETRVRELFATEPDLHEEIYGLPPKKLINEDAVIELFRDRVAPRVRLPRSYVNYLKNSWSMCFPQEDAEHFENLRASSVPLRSIDLAGRVQEGALDETVEQWLRDAASSATLLLLGEFGDGKSFFTYAYSRRLAEEYLGDPGSTYIPVRFSLKELGVAKSFDAYLTGWLNSIGLARSEWNAMIATNRILFMLDGFDEMSTRLDGFSVSRNLDLLVEAIQKASGPVTDRNRNNRIIVTSRGRFFDRPREEAALRERLDHPRVLRIKPISRTDVLASLSSYAKKVGLSEKLRKIKGLYDPIGLACKPLFLQMIKDTLASLPDNKFSAIELYRTYIDQSLARKSDLLLSGSSLELRSEVLTNLKSVLRRIALGLADGASENFDLRHLEASEELAASLWRMARGEYQNGEAEDSAAVDARMRVSIRSLLVSVASESEETWLVNFFHRSIWEFFLADAIAETLRNDGVAASRQVLGTTALSTESMDFVRQLLEDRPLEVRNKLYSCARSAGLGLDELPALGGNALSLYFMLFGAPHERHWTSLRLDNLRLVGADLTEFVFDNSSLRSANFDNATLSRASFRNCDLTGLRLEQTSRVVAVQFDQESSSCSVAYSDGALRCWKPTAMPGEPWSAEVVFRDDPPPRSLVRLSANLVAVLRQRDVVLLSCSSAQWTIVARFRKGHFLRSVGTAGDSQLVAMYGGLNASGGFLNLAGERPHYFAVNDVGLNDALRPLMLPGESDRTALVSGEWLLSNFFIGGWIGFRLWNVLTGQSYRLSSEFQSCTAFAISSGADGKTLIAAGNELGHIYVGELSGLDLVPLQRIGSTHDAAVTSIAVGSSVLISGGDDRRVLISHLDADLVCVRVENLYLTLRCDGIMLDGVQGEVERDLLQKFAKRTV